MPQIRAHLDPEAHERIISFLSEVDALSKKRVLRDTWQSPETLLRVTSGDVEMPTNDELLAILTQFRVFVLNDEPVNFLRIRKMVEKALHDAGCDDHNLGHLKDEWQKNEGYPVGGLEIIDLVFNGLLFHRDADKEREYEDLCGAHGGEEWGEKQVKTWCIMAVRRRMEILFEFDRFLRGQTDLCTATATGA